MYHARSPTGSDGGAESAVLLGSQRSSVTAVLQCGRSALLLDPGPLLDVSTSGVSRAVHSGAPLHSAWVVAAVRLGVQSTSEGACSVLNKFVGRETKKCSPVHFCSNPLPLCMKCNLFRVSQNSVDYINTCSAFGPRMWFTFESDVVHLRPT